MSEMLRVVHYINQFYGGFGGEDTAGMGVTVKEGAVGPGMVLQAGLKGQGQIVATVICGDNYVTENIETAVPEIVELVKSFRPDLFVAGPGFNAGRYGLACGAITAAVTEQLRIPAVTGLYCENPGAELYKDRCWILESGDHGKYLRKSMQKMTEFALLLAGEQKPDADAFGVVGSGPAPVIDYATPAARRAVDMLLAKFRGEPFETEVRMPVVEQIPLPVLDKPLNEAKIALVTDGGLVPAGNPDHLPTVNSKIYLEYALNGVRALDPAGYEVSHQGYDNTYVNADPNRLVPVDALRELADENKIGSMFDGYFVTTGVRTSLENAKKFGREIGEKLKADGVDAVLLTST